MDRFTGLSVFTQVADAGGFSAAARRLNMSTTMVSNHVQALEDRLGVRLLNRTTRKVSLTDVGRAYYERCVDILHHLEDADRAAGAMQATPRGTLRLYTGLHIVQFVAPVITEYLRRYEGTKVDLNIGERDVHLIEENIDIAIQLVPPPDSSLIVRHLAKWRHILCCAPAYLESHPPIRELADLAQHNGMSSVRYPFGNDWRFEDRQGKTHSVRITTNLVTNSGEALRNAAVAGLGVFLTPSFVVAEDLAAGRLVRLLPEYRPVEFSMNAVYAHRHHLSAKVRCFIDLLIAHGLSRQINPLTETE
jgi:DNA-binding transcriptional LysR family regulator